MSEQTKVVPVSGWIDTSDQLPTEKDFDGDTVSIAVEIKGWARWHYPTGTWAHVNASWKVAAPASETNASRTLLSSDAYCPNCGHNRDESAVSTIDHGEGIHACQMCGAVWRETNAAAEPNARAILNDLPVITDQVAIEILEQLAGTNADATDSRLSEQIAAAQDRQARGEGIPGDADLAHYHENVAAEQVTQSDIATGASCATPVCPAPAAAPDTPSKLPLTRDQIFANSVYAISKAHRQTLERQALIAITQEQRIAELVCEVQLLCCAEIDRDENESLEEKARLFRDEFYRIKEQLARYAGAERELPEEPGEYTLPSGAKAINKIDYNKLRDHAIAQTARVKELEAECDRLTKGTWSVELAKSQQRAEKAEVGRDAAVRDARMGKNQAQAQELTALAIEFAIRTLTDKG